MKLLRRLGIFLAACAALYLSALVFVDPRCKFDGNPFDCDDDVLGPIIHIVPDAENTP